MRNFLILLLWCTVISTSQAETHFVPSDSDTFDIESYAWLVGHWKGNGFGGISEEIWMPAVDGTMMGMYRHYKDGKISFYEFLLLDKDGLRLKHFHPDLKGWEEIDDFVAFPVAGHEKDKILLKGLNFEKISDNKIQIHLRLKQGDEVHTEVFDMTKVK